jgi:comEA protein
VTREERNVLLFVVAGVVVGSFPLTRSVDEPAEAAATSPLRAVVAGSIGVAVVPPSDSLAHSAATEEGETHSGAENAAVPVDLFPIDLNRASRELIEELPGIGPAKAKAIVELRERLGSFRSVDELEEVRGIGPRTVERLRDLVIVGKEDGGRDRERSHLGERQTGSAAPRERSPLGGTAGTGP